MTPGTIPNSAINGLTDCDALQSDLENIYK